MDGNGQPEYKMNRVKALIALFVVAGLMPAQLRNGNFTIRFEPTAALQANAEIPFEIHVTDDLRKPLLNATVSLQIETQDQHTQVKVVKAAQTQPGVYVAKPTFPEAGRWSVYVEVRRGDAMAARTIDYFIPTSAGP
jgi:YtkA-like